MKPKREVTKEPTGEIKKEDSDVLATETTN